MVEVVAVKIFYILFEAVDWISFPNGCLIPDFARRKAICHECKILYNGIFRWQKRYIDDLVQDCSKSSALAMELL